MDLTHFKKLSEEPLKSSVAKAFFENFDFSGDKIDFIPLARKTLSFRSEM
nr:hypothetical protein [Helicobacter pylori]